MNEEARAFPGLFENPILGTSWPFLPRARQSCLYETWCVYYLLPIQFVQCEKLRVAPDRFSIRKIVFYHTRVQYAVVLNAVM